MNSDKLLKAAHYITSPFGYRINPVTGKHEGHNGVDYGTSGKKVPCYAVADGIVRKVSQDRYGGNFCYVEYPSLNHYGLYYHLTSFSVKAGQTVKEGQQIGITGTTGQSTGVHLHFSWIESNSKSMQYYNATYEDFESYSFPKTHSENYKKVQAKYGFNDNTMAYLEQYKYAEDLFKEMLESSNSQDYQLNTINYISAYKYGKEVFEKLGKK
ncbi:M23 family metallopeptidase [Anaerovorax odorimutans]|uniref:M23 family metallopeptidase n=1 Tax=Anaerovorax odorimutans TaxID=109327 RepID=UPI000426FA1A|nr:M23 family metallopeptidase [Anaerovorax odorimutans]